MGKNPADQFYWGDWLNDVELQAAQAVTRGVWINALCRMWYAKNRGELEGTKEVLAQICNCTEVEFNLFLSDAKVFGFCEVSVRSADSCEILTIQNRRMYKAEKIRKASRLRTKKSYDKKTSTKTSRCLSSSSSSISLLPKGNKQALPAHFETKIKDKGILKLILETCKKIKIVGFNPFQYVQKNNDKHPKAILFVLEALQLRQGLKEPFKVGPWPYANKIMAVEHQNYNEKDSVTAHRQLMKEWGDWEEKKAEET